jgi:uncharacterized protein YacL (UPF0231 family)
VKIALVKIVNVGKESKMIKKLFLVLTLLFTWSSWSCEDLLTEEEYPMKLWLNGEEVDVQAEYQRITTFAEELEYFNDGDSTTYTKKILVIHFQKEDSRVDLNKEHYAVIFTDWEGDISNGQPIDEGQYQWPAQCQVCPRKCIHGAPSKWVRMEIIGDSDVAVSGEAHVDNVYGEDGSWTVSGTGEGIFYNPYAEANMEGRIEFTNLKVDTSQDNTPYFDYGGH